MTAVEAERHAAMRGRPVRVRPGPALLSGIEVGPSLEAHRRLRGTPPRLALADLLALVDDAAVRGRGGAGFPFAAKLRVAAQRRRRVVVVNLAEGEPASLKDSALALAAPHLVLDGAAATARALGARTVHVVAPGERPTVRVALEAAVAERRGGEPVRFEIHVAARRFVAGESSAVLELLSGRDNVPVTSWQPAAVKGHRGRPTLVSNAETFAVVGCLALGLPLPRGTRHEPGSTLLTIGGESGPAEVVEVELGTPWRRVLGLALDGPVLLGGYHGTWVRPGGLADLTVSRLELDRRGYSLGAGIVWLCAGCPVHAARRIAGYLAAESAGRCGPCVNGLPALVGLLDAVQDGTRELAELRRVAGLVTGRGACAHPDGTVRMLLSLVDGYADELRRHAEGWCAHAAEAAVAR